MDKKANFNAWYLMIAVLAMVVIQGLWQQAQRTEYLPYSEFETYLKDGKIVDLTITETRIIGELKGAEEGQPTSFVTTRVDPEFARQLQQYGVEFTGGTDSNFFSNLLSWVLPIVIFFGIWMLLLRRMSMGGPSATTRAHQPRSSTTCTGTRLAAPTNSATKRSRGRQ